jgi:COP9 signalosome complex subunit 7
VLATLDVKINDITKETALRKARQVEYDSHLQAQLKEIIDKKERQNASRRAQVDRDHGPMDVDDPPLELAKGKNRK